jgi:hypothetical protein
MNTFADTLRHARLVAAARTAVIDGDKHLSYAQLADRCGRLALSGGPGDRGWKWWSTVSGNTGAFRIRDAAGSRAPERHSRADEVLCLPADPTATTYAPAL